MRLDSPLGIAVHLPTGDVYIADTNNNQICLVKYGSKFANRIAGQMFYGYGGNGGPATAAILDAPIGLALDTSGNVYVADTYNNVVRRMYLSSSSFSSSPTTTSATTSDSASTTTTDNSNSNSNSSVSAVGGGIGAFLFIVSIIFVFRAMSQMCKVIRNSLSLSLSLSLRN